MFDLGGNEIDRHIIKAKGDICVNLSYLMHFSLTPAYVYRILPHSKTNPFSLTLFVYPRKEFSNIRVHFS